MKKRGVINKLAAGLLAAIMMIILVPLSVSASGSDAHSFSARVSCETEQVNASYTDDSYAEITFALSESCNVSVTFDYAVLTGSAGTDLLGYAALTGKVTFEPGDREKTVSIPVKKLVHTPAEEYPKVGGPDELWNGERVFYVSCSNIQNALFTDAVRGDCWELVVPVKVESVTDAAYAADFQALFDEATDELLSLGDKLRYTPDDLNKVRLPIRIDPNGAVRKLIDAGVLTHITLPTLVKNNEGVDEPMQVRLEEATSKRRLYSSDITFPAGETTLSLGSPRLGLGENEASLGPDAEGNGMVTDMELVFTFSDSAAAVEFDDANLLNFYDGAAPTVKEVSFGGDVPPMCTVPITVTFSEPVRADDVTLTVNSVEHTPVESSDTVSNKLSFLYSIGRNESELCCTVSGAVDINGNEMSEDDAGIKYSTAISNTQTTERMLLAGLSCDVAMTQGTEETMSGEITLSLTSNDELQNWVKARLDNESLQCSALKARVVAYDVGNAAGKAADISLYADNSLAPAKLTGSFTAPVNNTGADIKYYAELYYNNGSDFKLLYPLCTAYDVPTLRYISAADLTLEHNNWPESRRVRVVDDDLSMSYDCPNGLPTWNGSEYFKWSSNNLTVATINEETGAINFTGAAGTVSFTLTVSNPINDDAPTFTSDTLTVTATDEPYLSVPIELRNIELLRGGDAVIEFSSNLIANNADFAGNEGTSTAFTMTLYAADNSGGGLPGKGTSLWTHTLIGTKAVPPTQFTLPAERLTNVTAEGVYGYVAEVSARAQETGDTLTATAYIRVRPQQARPMLTRPDNLYVTDDHSSHAVGYTIENYDAQNTEFELSVRKNGESVLTQTDGYTGSVNVSVSGVSGRLLDAYTVSLKARNDSNDPWAFDSYTLYVYSAKAFAPLIDGNPQNSCTLGLPESITINGQEETFADMHSNVLYSQRGNLRPKVEIGLGRYPWSTALDKIKWSVTGGTEGGLLLRLQEGGASQTLAEDTLCSPNSSVYPEGILPGTYNVTVTHALTGASRSITVTVEDVSDKLLFLELTKYVDSTISYNDKSIEVHSGRTAIYDPDGFGGEVTITPKGESERLLYQSAVLRSSDLGDNQRVWAETGVYPVNTVTLKEMTNKVQIRLYTEDGDHNLTPYNGYVKVASGVFLDNIYLKNTEYKSGKPCAEQQILKTQSDYFFYSGEHRLEYFITLEYDRASFFHTGMYNEISTDDYDKLTYGFELIACDAEGNAIDTLLPVMKMSSDISGTILSASFTDTEKAESWLPPGCSYSSQYLTIDGVRMDYSKRLYIETVPKSVKLTTELLMTDAAIADYDTYLLDETGAIRARSLDFAKGTYPFSTLHTVASTIDLSYDISMFRWGSASGTRRGEILRLYPVFRKTDGTQVYTFPTPLQFQNLTNMPPMSSMAERYGALHNLTKLVEKLMDMDHALEVGDDNAQWVLGYIKSLYLSTPSAGLELHETDDPLVYEATFRLAVGSHQSSNPSGVFMDGESKSKFGFTPGVSEIKAMAKGTFLKKSKAEYASSIDGYRSTRRFYGGGFIMEGIVYFDIDRQEWCFAPYATAGCLGSGIQYERAYNFKVGPAPCTVKTIFTGTAEAGLKVFTNRGDGLDEAYIMSLLPSVSLRVSGGVGVDYKIVSLSAGPYGKITHSQHYLWQNSNGGQYDAWSNGQKLTVSGEAGIALEIELILYSYEKDWKLVSHEWNKVYNDYNAINKNYTGSVFSLLSADDIIPVGEDYALVPVEESAGIESRDYLTSFDRMWLDSFVPALRSLRAASALTPILTNAYPKSAPVLTQDGKLMVYLHDGDSDDINKTAACFALRNEAGGFEAKSFINEDGDHPDSGLTVAGTEAHAAAAWVRSGHISASAGDDASNDDILDMLTGTEIMVSVYNGSDWKTTALTNDERLDIAPAVAASGTKAVAAWLSAKPGTPEAPLGFSENRLMVSFYNGSEWSEPRSLLDAGTDSISDICAVMLPDGGAALSFLQGDTVVCATLNADGEVISLLDIAKDAGGAVRLTAAEFPDEITRYIIGWNAADETGAPILRLAAVNSNCTLYPDFSVELAHESGYNDFRFSKGVKLLTELSVLWSAEDYSESSGEATYPTVVFGQKLLTSDGSCFAAAPQELLRLDSGVRLRSFDAVTGDGDSFRIALTSKDSEGMTTIFRTDAAYQAYGVTLETPSFDYEEVRPGAETTVQFSVTNKGVAPITKLDIAIGDMKRTLDGLSVASGETERAAVIYSVPDTDTLSDADYTVTAYYAGGTTVAENGTLAFSLPDIRIDDLELSNESGGERQFDLTLGMPTYAPPSGTQSIRVQASATSDFSELVYEHTLTADEIAELKTNGSLRTSLILNLADPGFSGLLSNGELPQGGVWLYFRTVLKQGGLAVDDADNSNDYGFEQLVSLAEQLGRDISIGSALTTSGGTSTVRVQAFNNTLTDIQNGNLVVSLLDADGSVLETRQTYTGGEDSLLSVGRERAAEARTLNFTRAGASTDVRFARVTAGSARLSTLNLTGVPLTFAPDTYSYTLQSQGITETFVSAVAEDTAATLSAKLNGKTVSLTSPLALSVGEHSLVITVTGSGGSSSYALHITNLSGESQSDGGSSGNDAHSGLVYAAGGDTKMQVSTFVSGSAAILDIDTSKLKQLFDDGEKPVNVTIDLTTLPQSINSVRIGADDWQALSDAANSGTGYITGLTLITSNGRISLDSRALSAASGGAVTVNLATAKKSDLSPEQQAAAGDRAVIDVTVLRGSEEIGDLKGGGITISVPYSLGEDERAENVTVWHLAADGAMTELSGSYDAATKSVTFVVSHLSMYVVGVKTPDNPFVDVKEDVYYYDAVLWAVGEKITAGTTTSTFSPNDICTRAQMAAFLWRAAGSPEPTAEINPFTDVKEGDYYYKAVLWAAEKGITLGTNADGTVFSPNDTCTRGQMAAFLYRYAGSPAVTGSNPFTDVATADYYCSAVLWAASEGITLGTNAEGNEFSPNDNCTRGQCVTFLYRLAVG